MPKPSGITFCALVDLWPDLSALAPRTFAVPFDAALAARQLPDASHAVEFLHRHQACAERTVHRRLVGESRIAAEPIRGVLRHIPLGRVGRDHRPKG